MIVPDANLLLYAYNRDAPHHAEAKAWWEGLMNSDEPVGLPWATMLGFIRLMTHRAVLVTPLPAAKAVAHVRSWHQRRNVGVLEPGPRHDDLPKHLHLHPPNRVYYYKHPGMSRKANLGKDRTKAIQLANVLNTKYRTKREQEAMRLEAAINTGSPLFDSALKDFVEKYICDYRLKTSTAELLRQRRKRLSKALGNVQVASIDTQMLREAIADNSQFEQSKMRTLLLRFFRCAKSNGSYPSHLVNPVDDLFVDPVPKKTRHRMTLEQFRAMHKAAPEWLQWLMTLGFHLALRRIDLVNLRFRDIVDSRIVSPIRKTDTDARELEATSVDFPIHPDVQRVINEARRSSLRVGRCPFIVHRLPDRRTKRAADALDAGRMEHPAQILPDYATKAFNSVRQIVYETSDVFAGLSGRQLPTLHEIRALSSHLYAKAGYDVAAVQDLMAHTDPDMTRAYQKGHARKVLKVDMLLPFSVDDGDDGCVREERARYCFSRRTANEKKLSQNFLMAIG